MKKNRLKTVFPFDFELIGIVSSAKEYKLAWHLNQSHLFQLKKAEDIKIDFEHNGQIRVSVLSEETEYSKAYLLRNKLISSNTPANQFLIPELQRFDYLLKLSNQTTENWAKEVIEEIKHIPIIDYVLTVSVDKLKLKENLLF